MTSANKHMYVFMRRLNGEQAYMAAFLLDSMIHALWRTYGDDMANFQGRVFPDDPAPYSAFYCNLRDDEDDDF